jgi:hypothetical protein
LPYVTMIGEHTNGIFSYTLDKTLPNGWEYRLSYQQYFSADMACYEGKGVPVDVKLCNTRADIKNGVDPLIVRALDVLESRKRAGRARPSSGRHSVLMTCGAPRGRLPRVRTGPPLATSSVRMDGAIDQRAHDHVPPMLPAARSRGTSGPRPSTPPSARRSGDAGRRPGGG